MLTFFERLKRLEGFGLTEYQARVYLALLEFDVATASQIPSVSRVPRTKIYGIMRELHGKGLVTIIPETPLKYRAVEFGKFLQRQVRGLKEKASDLDSEIPMLAKEFEVKLKEPEARGKFEVLYGRRNVRAKLRDMYEAAGENVLSIGGETTAGQALRTDKVVLEDKAGEGVVVQYGYPITAANRDKTARVQEYAEVRHVFDPPMLAIVVVDTKDCLLIHRVPDDEDAVRGDDVALWTDDSAVVETMRAIADGYLERSADPSAHNSIQTMLVSMARWLAAVGMEQVDVMNFMGKKVGAEIGGGFKATTLDGALKELSRYWAEHGLGNVSILKKKPLTLAMDNELRCWERPELSKGLCLFVRAMVAEIIGGSLGVECKVKGASGCPKPNTTYCQLVLEVKEKKKTRKKK